jgi:hypothetical protein
MPRFKIDVETGAKKVDKKIASAQAQERKNILREASSRQMQIRAMRDLSRALRDNTVAVKSMPRGGGGVGGGAGGGIGGIGASVPIVGAFVGALGYITQQVMRVGRANIEKRMEQMSTAGITGGVLRDSLSQTMSIAQSGQYLRERAISAGRYAQGRPWQYQEGPTAAMLYGSTFGQAPQEVARTVGLLDVSTGGQGERAFERIADQLVSGGVETEMPAVIGAITDVMEEAVREGVNNSDMASDMAKEVSLLTAGASNRQARAALQTIQNMMTVQKSVAGGEFSSVAQYRMYRSAEKMLSRKGVQEKLIQSGYFTEQTDFENLDYTQKRVAVQYLSQQRAGDVREQYVRDIVQSLGGEGEKEERMRRFHVLAQDLGLSKDVEESRRLFTMAEGGGTQQPVEGAAMGEFRQRGITDASQAQAMQNRLDALVLSQDAAGEAYVEINNSLIALAETAGPKANATLSEFNTLIGEMTETMGESIVSMGNLIKDVREKGVAEGLFGIGF